MGAGSSVNHLLLTKTGWGGKGALPPNNTKLLKKYIYNNKIKILNYTL